ncbi:MAG: PDZ domain-containing protein, partial [Microbacterium sp.]
MTASAYLRFPHLQGDNLTFTADDDVWLAPTGGGRAWRVTTHRAPVAQPRLSPDGRHIAFVSRRDAHAEVYLADIDSGRTRRLTYWGGARTLLLGWSADGRILVASNAGERFDRGAVVKAIDTDGRAERLDIGAATSIAAHPDGRLALTTARSLPVAHWKRYRGGTAPRLWLRQHDQWQRLLRDDEAAIADVMWLGDTLAFVSDRAAVFPDQANEQANLWLWQTPGEGEPQLLTHQTFVDGYVRDATPDGPRIVWHTRGTLRLLESVEAEPRPLDVTLPGVSVAPRVAFPEKGVTSFAPDRTGSASIVSWLGGVFRLPHRDGPVHTIVSDSAVRAREATLLGDTGLVAFATDAEGDDALEIASVDGQTPSRRILGGELGRVLHLASTAKGTALAAISHDGAIRTIDVETGAATLHATSTQGEAEGLRFSPDGRYLVWSQPVESEGPQQLMCVDLQGSGDAAAVTDGHFNDRSPAFTRDGKHLVFLSNRTFDPHYDDHSFDLSFTGSTRPWLIPLSATQPAPFGPAVDGWPFPSDDDKPANKDDEKKDDAIVFDLDGAEDRALPFPVPSAEYTVLDTAKDAVLWIVEPADVGVLGSRRAGVEDDKPSSRLEAWSLPQRKVQTLAEKADAVAVSGDGTRLVVQFEGSLTTIRADRPTDDKDVVALATDRIRVDVDDRAQWRQMFDENARIMRDHFWREDMDGVDWTAVTDAYRTVLDRLLTHDDLEDLLWETVGELNTSHSYVSPPRPAGDQKLKRGFLGADLSPVAGGWRIDRILPSESSEPGARSPLRQAGVDAQVGDVITRIAGVAPDPILGVGVALQGRGGQSVELTLSRDGVERRVVVVPLEDDYDLRYQDWVRSRREYVAERSGGRLGYLHVPNMMSDGWAQLHRDLRAATRAEGVLADVRFNGGGHTSQLVIERLAARVIGYDLTRHGGTMSYPERARRGPVAFITNEQAGS